MEWCLCVPASRMQAQSHHLCPAWRCSCGSTHFPGLWNAISLWLNRETGTRKGWHLLFFTYNVLWITGKWPLGLFSRLNSFSSPLALSILLSLLNYVYNFAFPKVANTLVLGGFSIKRWVFDPLCKTWLACFTSPLCNLSAEQQINIQLITVSLLKSWSNQFKLKYNFWYYTVLLPALIYQNSYIYMSDAERRWSQKWGLLICIIIFEHFLIRDAFCISIDDFQLQWYVCSVFVINKLLWIFFHLTCEYVFTCTEKALLQRMSCVCLFLVIS